MTISTGRVAAIAVRQGKRGPMVEIAEVSAVVNGGIEPDHPVKHTRGITFISSEQWTDVERELGASLPWHTRRANVLVESLDLRELAGKEVQIGGVRVAILGETLPCERMDQLHPGLRAALTPDMRGGVHGQVLHGGVFQVGDEIRVAG